MKSQGFHLEQTRLDRPERIDRLRLRRRVDRNKHPKCSLFTLGLRWIHRLLELDKLPDVALLPVL